MKYMNQKGFANIILVVVIVVLVGAVGYFVFVNKSEPVVQQPTPTPTQTQTSKSPTPTPAPITQQNLKGWLLIYDPSATVSELHNKGFKPLTWYLAPKDSTWPGSPSSDIELAFNNDSICYKPKDQFSDAIEFNCKEPKIKWGYGDRVRIWGSKSNNVVTVSRMEIVSSLPVEQW